MAKGRDEEEAEIEFVYFKARGSNATLQTIIDKAVNAIRPPIVRVVSPPALPSQSGQSNGHSNGNGASAQLPLLEAEMVEVVEETPETTAQHPPSKPKRQRQYTTPEILDINLTEGDMPLATFFEQKGNPSDHSKRYLIIAAWFREYRNETAITRNHIWTCYRHMRWNTIRDIDSVFHHGKAKGLYKSAGRGLHEITHNVGLNEVNRMGGAE